MTKDIVLWFTQYLNIPKSSLYELIKDFAYVSGKASIFIYCQNRTNILFSIEVWKPADILLYKTTGQSPYTHVYILVLSYINIP